MSEATCPCCGSAIAPRKGVLVSLDTNTAAVGTETLRLTPQQTELLYVLSKAYPRVAQRQSICANLWGVNECEQPFKVIETRVCQLRKLLKPLGVEIETVRERGYRLVYQ